MTNAYQGRKDEIQVGPPAILRQMINGFQLSQAIRVAAELEIADRLSGEPLNSDDLALLTDSKPAALYRLLRALAAAGIFCEDETNRFSLTDLGECLRTGVAGSRLAWAKYSAGRPAWDAWGQLLESVRTGENAFRRAHGMDVWRFRAQNPTEGVRFNAAMHESSDEIAAVALSAYDFGRFRHIIDIGGGDGALLARLILPHPSTNGTLVDQPHIITETCNFFRRSSLAARCRAISGSFFEILTVSGDAILLKFILHNWQDDQAISILRNCRTAIESHGRLLVFERILGGRNEGVEGKFADLNMLVHPSGKERTLEQYAHLLATTHFQINSVIPLVGELVIIEATIS
jgi:hypothetical protein